MGIWTLRPEHHPNRSAWPASPGRRQPLARRSAVRGTVAFVCTLVAGGWVMSNLTETAWLVQYGASFLTDLAAPTVALAAVLAGSVDRSSTRLAPGDRLLFGVAVSLVVAVGAGTWHWIGVVSSLTPLLLGSAALVVMRSALMERRARIRRPLCRCSCSAPPARARRAQSVRRRKYGNCRAGFGTSCRWRA